MNGGAQYSTACEGASLPWVQIPPPLPLTCDDASPLCLLRGGGHRGGLSFGPQMVSVDRAGMPAAGWIGPELRPRTPADKIWEETRRVPVGAGRSPYPGRRVRQAGAAFLSPAGPPSPCARRRSVHHAVQGWRDRPPPAGYPPTYRPLTLSDREVLENACRPDPDLRGRGGGSDVVVPARRPGRRTRATSRTVSPSVLDAAMTRNY